MIRSLPRFSLLFLAFLTVLALLPWDPQGPFDARDYSPMAGVELVYPWEAVLFEPLLAPAHAIAGAPDFRLALFSTALWVVVGAMLMGAWRGRGVRRFVHALWFGLVAAGMVSLYTGFMALGHLPGPRLEIADPELLAIDLQSHTFGSHDGLVTAAENLAWHAKRGYHLVAITEHLDPAGSFAAQEVAEKDPRGPAVIPGVEVRVERGAFLLGVGLTDGALPIQPRDGSGRAASFVAEVHRQGGAVIALSWLLEPAQVEQLRSLGVDAMELINTGHPDVAPALRAAMLDAAERGLLLVASTDWHGWSGVSRSWTLMRVPGAAHLDGRARAQAVVDRLRSRDAHGVIPVVAGLMGTPPDWRVAFAPTVELTRYGAELSPARLASWWLWVLVIAAGMRAASRAGVAVRPAILGVAALALGGVVAWRAMALLSYRDGAGVAHEYGVEIGTPGLALGLAGLTAGLVTLVIVLLRWRNVRVPTSTRKHGSAASETPSP